MPKILDKTKIKFKEFCDKYRLNYKLDECGDPISPTRKPALEDHLYWMGSDESVGVFIQRETECKYNHLKKKLVSLGCIVRQDGDTEGTLQIPYKKAWKVARFLGVAKNSYTTKQRKEASKRMKELWKNGKMNKKKKQVG